MRVHAVFRLWILILVSLLRVNIVDGACSLPMNSGSWLSTDKGTLSLTSSTIKNYPTKPFGAIDLECYTNSGSNYILRSSSFSNYAVVVRVYMCFVFNRVNSYQYFYYLGSEEDATLSNERMKTVAAAATVTFSDICDRTVFPEGLYYILVQNGYASQAASTCSTTIQATWTYTYTDNNGNFDCTSDSELDICTDKTTLSFNYTACSRNIMYSAGGELYCLYSSVKGSMTYQHVYNKDATTTNRITCLVLSVDKSKRYLTQYPNNCYDGQTSKSVIFPGASLVFTLINACPYTTEENFTAAIALGVLVPLALIIVTAIIIFLACKHYKENKEPPTPTPDPKYANGEIRNKRLSKPNGVRIDETTTIYDTPRSVEINMEEKLLRPESSIIGDDMSVSVRRESSILLDINPSTRGTMVAESLPEMSEKDYSSEYSDSEAEDLNENENQFNCTSEFLEIKSEGTQTPNVPQIVLDSVGYEHDIEHQGHDLEGEVHDLGDEGHDHGGEEHHFGCEEHDKPDLVPQLTNDITDQQTTTPEQQFEATQTDKKKKKKKKKSASFRVKSASKRQKPDRYGNTEDRLVFGTRVTILKIRPKSFRKKKQVDPLRTDEDSPIDPSLNDLVQNTQNDSKGDDKQQETSTIHQTVEDSQKETDNGSTNNQIIPDETREASNTSVTNLKRNESMLREKIYRVTNRDISSSKRRKKQPKLRHPLEKSKGKSPEPIASSWFKHKTSSAARSAKSSRNTFGPHGDNDDVEVSPKVNEHGNLLEQNDNSDTPTEIRPPTQQKPFVNPKVESTEEVFEKIKSMWHFGNRWLGNTYIAHTPR